MKATEMYELIMKDVIRFDIIKGSCAICQGPVYFSQVIDNEGNRVNTLHCWNGHYEQIEIEHVGAFDDSDMTLEQIEGILPFIEFVRLDEEKDNGHNP